MKIIYNVSIRRKLNTCERALRILILATIFGLFCGVSKYIGFTDIMYYAVGGYIIGLIYAGVLG